MKEIISWRELARPLLPTIESSTNFNVNQVKGRLVDELQLLKGFLDKFPLCKSFTVSEIMYALDPSEFILLKSSVILLIHALDILHSHSLLHGIFMRDIGIYHTDEDLELKVMEKDLIDQLACKGLMAVDRSDIVMTHVYNNSKCPFCFKPVKVEDFITIKIPFQIIGGITLSELKINNKVSFHKTD